jgi:hypothetical protein
MRRHAGLISLALFAACFAGASLRAQEGSPVLDAWVEKFRKEHRQVCKDGQPSLTELSECAALYCSDDLKDATLRENIGLIDEALLKLRASIIRGERAVSMYERAGANLEKVCQGPGKGAGTQEEQEMFIAMAVLDIANGTLELHGVLKTIKNLRATFDSVAEAVRDRFDDAACGRGITDQRVVADMLAIRKRIEASNSPLVACGAFDKPGFGIGALQSLGQ